MHTKDSYLYDSEKDELFFFSYHNLSNVLRELFSNSEKKLLKCFLADHEDFNDKELRALFKWGEVERLVVAGTKITCRSRDFLKGLHLKQLDLSDTNVGDRFFASFNEFEILDSLTLNGTSIGDSGVKNLPENLRVLRLDDTEITTRTLRELSRFKNLETLSIAQFLANDNECIDHLDVIPTLKSLTLNDSLIGTHGFSAGLCQKRYDCVSANFEVCVPNLEELSLVDCGIGSEDLTCITKLIKLSNLNLRRNPGVESVSEIISNTNLLRLNLSRCNLSRDSFEGVDQSSLRTLILSRNPRLDITSYTDIGRLGNIHDLNLSGCSVTNGGLKILFDSLPLFKLSLERSKITAKVFEGLHSPSLEVLDVRDTSFSWKNASHLVNFPKLRYLKVANTPLVDDEISLGQFRKSFPHCLVNTTD